MNNKIKEYKALMLDLDGTTVPDWPRGMPSERVTKAIAEARKKIYVGIATSRPYLDAQYIIEHLDLSGPCIVNNGAQVIDARSRKILREQRMLKNDVLAVYEIVKKMNLVLQINTMLDTVPVGDISHISDEILGAMVPYVNEETANLLIERISHIPTVVLSKIPSNKDKEYVVGISHASATKQHGILEVARILDIGTHEIIGVGDGDNDFPLLLACGLRVAMGNAVNGLKEFADYVAPPVFDDGVVDVIEKFVLRKKL